MKERKYEISQFPGPRNLVDNIPKHLIVKSRKCKDYSVLEVHNPGVNGKWVYYLKADAAFIVSGKPLDFNDPVLDKLVGSFEKIKEDGKK